MEGGDVGADQLVGAGRVVGAQFTVEAGDAGLLGRGRFLAEIACGKRGLANSASA